MKRMLFLLTGLLCTTVSVFLHAAIPPASTEDIISDIYRFLAETEETDYEELQETLLEMAAHPVNLNSATREDLAPLRFLSDEQIDRILLYAYRHPMDSLTELRLIPGLQDYEIRDLLPFVCVRPVKREEPVYWREMLRQTRHEVLAWTDVRYAEDPHRDHRHDPFYTRLRYKLDCHRLLQAGFTLQRPTGTDASGLQYGGYIQLNRIRHLHTLVLGNYQAQFGQGLVAAYPFHTGKAAYMQQADAPAEGLRKYTSTDGRGLHGIGGTLRFGQADVSVWYSLTRENDSLRRHTAGANITFRHKNFKAGITAAENIWSDTLRYHYEHAAYNQHYFRGTRQFTGGANFRWRRGITHLFGEAATAQNKRQWGWGVLAGIQVNATADADLTLLYRYYSPDFDNPRGYAFSETSRANDENGLYIGADIRSLPRWRFSVYGDVFRFAAVKYGIPYAPSWGYDTRADILWHANDTHQTMLRLRARMKGGKSSYTARWQWDCRTGGWRLRSEADASLATDSLPGVTCGFSVFIEAEYTFRNAPLSVQGRLQSFNVQEWDNRIYLYEKDVLYGWSVPAVYGKGNRLLLNLRWQIIPQLTVYLRLSETVYSRSWAERRGIPDTRTDVHLLLRTVL